MRTNEEIIEEAIDEAIAFASGNFEVGQKVAHRSDPLTHLFIRSEEGVAFVERRDGAVLQFPLAELFDPNDCKRFAIFRKATQATFCEN